MENVTILDFLLCLGDLIWYLVGLFSKLSYLMFTGSISRIEGFGLLARIVASVLLMGLILMICFPFECPSNTRRRSDDDYRSYELLEWQLFHRIPLPTVGSTFSELIGNKLNQEVQTVDKVRLYILTNKPVEQSDQELQIEDWRIHRNQTININDDEIDSSDDSELSMNLSGESEEFHSSQINYLDSKECQISSALGEAPQVSEPRVNIIEEKNLEEPFNFPKSTPQESQISELIPIAYDDNQVPSVASVEVADKVLLNSAIVSPEHRSVPTRKVMKTNDLEKSNTSGESSNVSVIEIVKQKKALVPRILQMNQSDTDQIETVITVINPDATSNDTEEQVSFDRRDRESEKVELLVSVVNSVRDSF